MVDGIVLTGSVRGGDVLGGCDVTGDLCAALACDVVGGDILVVVVTCVLEDDSAATEGEVNEVVVCS